MQLDPGLRRDDGGFGLSKCHSGQSSFIANTGHIRFGEQKLLDLQEHWKPAGRSDFSRAYQAEKKPLIQINLFRGRSEKTISIRDM